MKKKMTPEEAMSAEEVEQAQSELVAILEAELPAHMAVWDARFSPGDDPSQVGVLLKLPQEPLDLNGIREPQGVCVLRRDLDSVTVVPLRIGRLAEAGEALIAANESPFGTPVALCLWCSLTIPRNALSLMQPIARIPGAVMDPILPTAGVLSPPWGKRHIYRTWLKVIASLSGSMA